MYKWRHSDETTRCEIMRTRKLRELPWHYPPHFDGEGLYILTAANFEHTPIIGMFYERISRFSQLLLDTVLDVAEVKAWCVLPNHYHILVELSDLVAIVKVLGHIHGVTSFEWNKEDGVKGRKCWHGVCDRKIRNANHYYATLNYIHNNPVKHGCVEKWPDWQFSSARQFLEESGREQALSIWTQYPLFDYGKGWDD